MSQVVQAMTFLQLSQRLQQESGSSGAAQTTTVNATGEWKRLCDWIAQAYIDLQLYRDDWEWMEQDVVFDTIANQQSYPPATTTFTTPAGVGLADFRRWKLCTTTGASSFRLYLKSAGVNNETFLDGTMSYNEFRDYYMFGARRNTYQRPISIVSDPHKSLLFGLGPNDVFTVNGKYYTDAIKFTADADTPAFPARYHMLIVYWALVKYAYFEAAPEVLTGAKTMLTDMLFQLEDEQLPDIEMPDPMA